MSPAVCIVVAMARNRVIGRNGDLPWRISADLRYFKAVTMGKPVIMGRKTFESIGRPLPGRTNIVVTRNAGFAAEGVRTAPDLGAALRIASDVARGDGVDEVMVIGGGALYAAALPGTARLYLTEVDAAPDGDVRFPEFDRAQWREVRRDRHGADGDTPAFDFVLLEKA